MKAPLADSESFEVSSISDSLLDKLEKKPKIPDGGWGWMVVLSSFVISVIIDGISFSFGLLYTEFYYEFGGTSSETSWIGSVFLSVPLLTGPIMSALVDKYGCRKMTIIGGLISCFGFLISSRIKSLGIMYLTFGVLSGLGLGLNYITAVVSIPFWFDKKRNLAVGLGACGSGFGTFIYAPLTTWLLYEFGWRGTVVQLAGTLLNLCVCGALMRDPDWIDEENKSLKSSTLSLRSVPDDLNEIKKMLKDGKDKEFILQTLAMSVESGSTSKEIEAEGLNNKDHYQSVLNLPTFIKRNEKVPIEVLEQLSTNKRLYKVILENYPSLLLCRSTSDRGLNKLAEDASLIATRVPVTVSVKLKEAHDNNRKLKEIKEQKAENAKRNFVTHHHYFKNLRFPRQSLIQRGAILNKNKYRLKASSCPNIYKVSMMSIDEDEDWWWETVIKAGKEMFDFSSILEFHFFILSISTLIQYAWFMTPYFYLADHMEIIGYTKTEASFVLGSIGITNTIGMVVLGWAGDQAWCNVPKVHAICLVLCGICCCGIMFVQNYYVFLTIVSGLYGFFLAGSFSFMPTIIMELIPLKKFTSAYGLMLLFCGIGHLGGPPLAGLLKDVTLSWDLSFHVSGIWIIVAGFLAAIIPYTKNKRMFGDAPIEEDLESS